MIVPENYRFWSEHFTNIVETWLNSLLFFFYMDYLEMQNLNGLLEDSPLIRESSVLNLILNVCFPYINDSFKFLLTSSSLELYA